MHGVRGAGRTIETKELEVEIPAGIHDGQRIRIRGAGHAGTGGGLAGDAYVEVHVARDPRFERDGDDILSEVDLTIVAGGARRAAHGPDARRRARARLRRPAPSRARCASCAARGCRPCSAPAAATTACSSTSSVPRRLTDEQRELLDRFDELSGEDTYRRDEGFFEKLRSAIR